MENLVYTPKYSKTKAHQPKRQERKRRNWKIKTKRDQQRNGDAYIIIIHSVYTGVRVNNNFRIVMILMANVFTVISDLFTIHLILHLCHVIESVHSPQPTCLLRVKLTNACKCPTKIIMITISLLFALRNGERLDSTIGSLSRWILWMCDPKLHWLPQQISSLWNELTVPPEFGALMSQKLSLWIANDQFLFRIKSTFFVPNSNRSCFVYNLLAWLRCVQT